MILFKPEHVPMILAGRKTQTRRTWDKPRVKVGRIYQCRTSYYGKPFARVRVTELRRERLGDISDADVYAEGYDSREALADVWRRIHGKNPDPAQEVWVVTFEIVQ